MQESLAAHFVSTRLSIVQDYDLFNLEPIIETNQKVEGTVFADLRCDAITAEPRPGRIGGVSQADFGLEIRE